MRKMVKYKDGLGYEYNVPAECVSKFEYRRRQLLYIAIVSQIILLACMLYMAR